MHEWTTVTLQDLVDFIELLSRNPDVWSREPAKIENPVKHGHRFRTKLPVDVLFIDNHGVFSFVKSKGEVGLAQPVNGGKDRMFLCPLIGKERVFSPTPCRGQNQR